MPAPNDLPHPTIGPVFQSVIDRLKAALGVTSNRAVSEALGIKPGTLGERKSRNALPMEEIKELCEKARLSLDWVLFGRGHMKVGGEKTKAMLDAIGDTREKVAALSLHDDEARRLRELLYCVSVGDRELAMPYIEAMSYANVRRFDVKASAGTGSVVDVPEHALADSIAFRPDWLKLIGVKPKDAIVISVRGDSMADTLQDGDLILVDTCLVERRVAGVYVIVKGDALLVKRLNFKVNGSIEIRSDNKAYPTETMSGAEFDQLHIVGRMVRRLVR